MKRSLKASILAVACGLYAAAGSGFAQSPVAPRSAPEDWSHRHLLYPNPDTREEAARKGTLAFEQWKKNYQDPRFALQVAKKTRYVEATAESAFSPQERQWADRFSRTPAPTGPASHRDWSAILGFSSGSGKAGTFPAKFQFDINAVPSCANDFIVYTSAAAGVVPIAGSAASQTATFTGQPSAGQTATITDPSGKRTLTLTASASLNTGTNFQIGATTTATAANLAAAIQRTGLAVGVGATNSGSSVTVTAIGPGTVGNNIALGGTLSNVSVPSANLAGGTGTAGQATILAFNQLYASCGASPTPATFWSYNTGNSAVADLSPVLSLDGTEVAFIQRSSSNVASLVVLKWSSSASVGSIVAPTTPTSVSASAYPSCTAPCMTTIALSGNPNDTYSSPFYDYRNDILYVGDDGGKLHKFTGVFAGTPAEQLTGGFPATVSSGNQLSSPVYDSTSGLVFVGSKAGASTGGQLHSVSSTGAVVSSGTLSVFNAIGVRDAPIVDSNAQFVYAFVGSDTNNRSAVYRFATNSTINGKTTPRVEVGLATSASVLYSGTFDNGYYSSANPASPSGNLYICGGATATSLRPTLWKIAITQASMGTPAAGPLLVNGNAVCSPVTEIMNGTNDYIYASVTASGSKSACTGACIYEFNLTGLTWGTGVNPNAGLSAPGGTGGIIVDNISATTGGASQVYYSTLSSPGNAIQASQAGLQ